jgi:hypothetical protein
MAENRRLSVRDERIYNLETLAVNSRDIGDLVNRVAKLEADKHDHRDKMLYGTVEELDVVNRLQAVEESAQRHDRREQVRREMSIGCLIGAAKNVVAGWRDITHVGSSQYDERIRVLDEEIEKAGR